MDISFQMMGIPLLPIPGPICAVHPPYEHLLTGDSSWIVDFRAFWHSRFG